MTAENSWHSLQQAEEERVEPVLALPQLWQLSDPDLKVEEDLRLWTLKKRREAEKTKRGGGKQVEEEEELKEKKKQPSDPQRNPMPDDAPID